MARSLRSETLPCNIYFILYIVFSQHFPLHFFIFFYIFLNNNNRQTVNIVHKEQMHDIQLVGVKGRYGIYRLYSQRPWPWSVLYQCQCLGNSLSAARTTTTCYRLKKELAAIFTVIDEWSRQLYRRRGHEKTSLH